MDRPAVCARLSAGAREMTGAGVPVFQPNVRNGIVHHAGTPPSPLAGGRARSRWHQISTRYPYHYPSVVESGHKMRQPRAGHPFPVHPGSASAGRATGVAATGAIPPQPLKLLKVRDLDCQTAPTFPASLKIALAVPLARSGVSPPCATATSTSRDRSRRW